MLKKIKLDPKTSFSELFSADQIFGQFVWAISDLYGQDAATKFVKTISEKPYIRFSSAMIDGFLPYPVYLNGFNDSSSEIGKHNKKCKWIKISEFAVFQKDPSSISGYSLDLQGNEVLDRTTEIHVSINRNTMASMEGGLFNSSYMRSQLPLAVYVSIEDSQADVLMPALSAICNYWNHTGLGGDRNIGRGQFNITIENLNEIEQNVFTFDAGDAFISLSNCFGADLKPVNYSVEVYSGIVGRGNADSTRYRKMPIVRYKEGALFIDGIGEIKQGTGYSKSISSYGYVFPLNVVFSGGLNEI